MDYLNEYKNIAANPAISTISTVAGITLLGLHRLSRTSSLLSGTIVEPMFGSIVQKGKFAL